MDLLNIDLHEQSMDSKLLACCMIVRHSFGGCGMGMANAQHEQLLCTLAKVKESVNVQSKPFTIAAVQFTHEKSALSVMPKQRF